MNKIIIILFLSFVLILVTVATVSAATQSYSLNIPVLGETRTYIKVKTYDEIPGKNSIQARHDSHSRGTQVSMRWRRWDPQSNKFIDNGSWTTFSIGDQIKWTNTTKITPGCSYCVAIRNNLAWSMNVTGRWWW